MTLINLNTLNPVKKWGKQRLLGADCQTQTMIFKPSQEWKHYTINSHASIPTPKDNLTSQATSWVQILKEESHDWQKKKVKVCFVNCERN